MICIMKIGNKIRALREARNLKQKELAEKINVSATALTFIEKGIRQPSKEMVLRLAKFFNKPTDYFLFEETTCNTDEKPVNTADVLMIADIVSEYLNKNGFKITPEQRAMLVDRFYQKNITDAEKIKEMLSFMQGMDLNTNTGK